MATNLQAAEQPGSGSLYIPKAQQVTDRALLDDFMDEFAFADLVTGSPSIRVTHIPTLLDRKSGTYGTIFGHVSRNNPQHETFDGQAAVIVFHGPDAYISPTWYTNQKAVPTWNFAVVHASGKPRAITDKKVLRDRLSALVRKFEGTSSYGLDGLPDAFLNPMLDGIVGFEMPIESLEGKFKLGQERSEADRAGLLAHLNEPMRGFTAKFYKNSR